MKNRLMNHFIFIVLLGTNSINAIDIEIPIHKDSEGAEMLIDSKTKKSKVKERKSLKSLRSCDKYRCVKSAKELSFVIDTLQENDVIILKDNSYKVHNLRVDKSNVTIASEYFLDGDVNHIKKTILIENNLKDAIDNPKNEYLIKGIDEKNSTNLHIVGLTFKNVKKGIGFYKGGGVVDHCDIRTHREEGTDAISFEKVKFGGGEVKYSTTSSYDEGVDIDTYKGKGGSGKFYIHHNHFKEGIKDDLIEVRLQSPKGKFEIEIANNVFQKTDGNAIQFIDYEYSGVIKISIHHNLISNSRFSGIDTTENRSSKREHLSSPLKEKIAIYNNYFINNGHHIDGGVNMQIENNIFDKNSKKDGKGNKPYALAWVGGKSIISNNLFYRNINHYFKSNIAKDNETDKIEEVKAFAKKRTIPLP